MKKLAFLLLIFVGFGCRTTPTYSGLSDNKISNNAFSTIVKHSDWDESSSDGTYYMPAIQIGQGRYSYLQHVGIHPGGGFLAVVGSKSHETRLESISADEVKLAMLINGQSTVLEESNDVHAAILADMVKVLIARTNLTENDSAAFLKSYCSGVTGDDLKSMINEPKSWTETCTLENGQALCYIEGKNEQAGKKYIVNAILKIVLH